MVLARSREEELRAEENRPPGILIMNFESEQSDRCDQDAERAPYAFTRKKTGDGLLEEW